MKSKFPKALFVPTNEEVKVLPRIPNQPINSVRVLKVKGNILGIRYCNPQELKVLE